MLYEVVITNWKASDYMVRKQNNSILIHYKKFHDLLEKIVLSGSLQALQWIVSSHISIRVLDMKENLSLEDMFEAINSAKKIIRVV